MFKFLKSLFQMKQVEKKEETIPSFSAEYLFTCPIMLMPVSRIDPFDIGKFHYVAGPEIYEIIHAYFMLIPDSALGPFDSLFPKKIQYGNAVVFCVNTVSSWECFRVVPKEGKQNV